MGGMAAAIASLAIFGLFFVILVVGLVYATRYKKVGPNRVLVISGRRRVITDPVTGEKAARSFRFVRGGGTFIWPVVERVDDLSLEIMTIEIESRDVPTIQGVKVAVDAVAQIKVGGDDHSIATAAERFLDKGPGEIIAVAHEALAGHLRAIVGTLTVEEIYRDRDRFAQKVQEFSAGDLSNMGLKIDSFVIKDIRDEWGYIEALGRPDIADRKAEAEVREANARQRGETAKRIADTQIAEADKNKNVQIAAYNAEVNQEQAKAELAYPLQQNISNQRVKAEEVQIAVVEKQKQIEVQEQEVSRKEKELDATVRKPAEAEQYKVQTLASARKFQTLTEAEGQAEAIRSVGQGEADAAKAKGLAQAEVIQAQGFAQAEVTKAQGFAEAEAMHKKAEAWQQYNQAAIIQQLIDSLPKVAAAIAQPLANTSRIVVISSGGDGAGAAKITQDVADIIAQVPTTVEALTGVDLVQTIKDLPGVKRAAEE